MSNGKKAKCCDIAADTKKTAPLPMKGRHCKKLEHGNGDSKSSSCGNEKLQATKAGKQKSVASQGNGEAAVVQLEISKFRNSFATAAVLAKDNLPTICEAVIEDISQAFQNNPIVACKILLSEIKKHGIVSKGISIANGGILKKIFKISSLLSAVKSISIPMKAIKKTDTVTVDRDTLPQILNLLVEIFDKQCVELKFASGVDGAAARKLIDDKLSKIKNCIGKDARMDANRLEVLMNFIAIDILPKVQNSSPIDFSAAIALLVDKMECCPVTF
jgi:hypothetical protein